MQFHNILVTGGAGFLGVNLVRYLLQRGYTAAVLDMAPFDYPDCADRVRAIRGDIRDRAAVDHAVNGNDLVVHCAAALPLYRKKDIFSTEVNGTRNVLQSALDHEVSRVIHISSTAVYGIPDHHPLNEDDNLRGVGPYGEAKILAERLCLEFRRKGLCIPILRPKTFIGPERLGVFALLFDWARDGRNFPLIGNGQNRYQLLDVEDLCEAIRLCINADATIVNDVFNIGAKEFATMREDYQAVLDYARLDKRIIALPAWPVIQTLRLLELLHLSPLYKWVYETAATDSFVSIDKAQRLLGFTPEYSNKQSLIRNYQWYLDHLGRFEQASGISHRTPWRQGILRLFKAFF